MGMARPWAMKEWLTRVSPEMPPRLAGQEAGRDDAGYPEYLVRQRLHVDVSARIDVDDSVRDVAAAIVDRSHDVQAVVGDQRVEVPQHTRLVLVDHRQPNGRTSGGQRRLREVDRVADDAVLDVVLHLVGSHRGRVLLSFLRRRAEVRHEDAARLVLQTLLWEIRDVAALVGASLVQIPAAQATEAAGAAAEGQW